MGASMPGVTRDGNRGEPVPYLPIVYGKRLPAPHVFPCLFNVHFAQARPFPREVSKHVSGADRVCTGLWGRPLRMRVGRDRFPPGGRRRVLSRPEP